MINHLFRGIAMLALLAAGSAMADGLPKGLWHTDAPRAWQTAQQHQRPMVIFVSMENCPHCLRMAGQTFRNRHVQAELTSFVPLYVKLEENRDLVKKLGVTTFPTTMVVAPDTTVLDEFKGFRSPEQMKQRLSVIRTAMKSPAAGVDSARRESPPRK